MLTPRENLLETLRGGSPDRYVNQFEAFRSIYYTPQELRFPEAEYGGEPRKNYWGVTYHWPEGTPGAFPMCNQENAVIKDITRWRDYLKMPDTDFSEEEWAPIVEEAKKVDRSKYLLTHSLYPGLFENLHSFMPIDECMIAFYTEPEIMHEIIDYVKTYELKIAEQVCKYIQPDVIMRGDDWGTQVSTFLSKEMFREFLLEPTKELYSYYKDHGVQLIVHHSDSFCETLVPEMIEMGIDIWQGALDSNNIPRILEEYGDKLTIMGGLNNGKLDRPDWTKEGIEQEVRRVCDWAGTRHFIPCLAAAADMSVYEGVYDCVSEAIDKISKEKFGG